MPSDGSPGTPEARDFDAFVVAHRVSLVRLATLLCESSAQAEDLVQDVLIRLYPRWERLAEPLPYVRRCIANEFVSWRRRWSTRHIRPVPDAVLADAAPPEPPVEIDSRDGVLWSLVQHLPRQQRAAVVLRFYEGWDDTEIGAALACRPGTVRAHVSRGLATLRSGLGEAGGTGDEMGETG